MAYRFIACLCIAAQLTGCATFNPVQGTGKPINAGETIHAVMRSGEDVSVVVTAVTDDTICAASGCFAIKDAVVLERREVNVFATVMLVVAGVGLTALLVTAAQGAAAAAIWAGAH